MQFFPTCLSIAFLIVPAFAQDPSELWHKQGGSLYGTDTAAAGDLDQDGYADVAIASLNGAEIFSGSTSALLLTIPPHSGANLWGSVCTVGDLNGDSIPDYAVSNSGIDHSGLTNAGGFFLHSGSDGALLYQYFGTESEGFWAYTMEPVGDVNADGTPDLLVGSSSSLAGIGKAIVYSGLDGSVLHELLGSTNNDERFCHSAAAAGDVNHDGYDDFIIGAYANGTNGIEAGMARVYSGLDGSTLFEFLGANEDDRFGIAVDAGMDANGDNYPDFVIVADMAEAASANGGVVYVYSGWDGSLLWDVNDYGSFDIIGRPMFLGDINGDGYDDVSMGGTNGWDHMHIRSGLNGDLLYDVETPSGDQFAGAMNYLGDVNDDGNDDFCVSGAFADQYAFVVVYAGVATSHNLVLYSRESFVAGTAALNFVFGTPPSQTVWLLSGSGHGRSFHHTLGTLDIQNALVVATQSANISGTARLKVHIPPRFAGTPIWLQAVNANLEKSNVVYRVIQ